MYLRKSKKPNGRTYLTIVQGYRDEDGKNKARTVRSLGYVDALEAEFDDPVAHFEEECRRMTAEAARAEAPIAVEFTASKKIDKRAEGRVELGAAVPSAYLHRDLGIWSFFERKRTARGFSYDPCRILELLVWDRIAHPSSKRAAWEARRRFPRKCGFTADDVYRCLTYLDENADALVSSMNASLEESRGPRDASCLYYDVTNYYFECDEEDGFRMRGVSKEHRPSPIVQMGLFLDSDGLPLGYELFPGNRNDMTTLLPAMSKAGVRDLPWGERVVVVADKGLNTSANIAACVLDGNGYIFSQSVRKAAKGLKSWVLDDAGYEESASGSFKIKSRISEKAVYVAGEDGKRRRVTVPVKEVAFWSRDYFERSRRERAKVVEKSRAAVAAATVVGGGEDVCALREGRARRARDRRGRRPQLGGRRGEDRRRRGHGRLLLHRHLRAGDGRPRRHRRLPRALADRGVLPGDEGRLRRAPRLLLHRVPHTRPLPRLLHSAARHAAHAAGHGAQILRSADIGGSRRRDGPPHGPQPLPVRLPDRPHRRARGSRRDRPVAPGAHPRADPIHHGGCEETEELGRTTPEKVTRKRAVLPAQRRRTALFGCKS